MTNAMNNVIGKKIRDTLCIQHFLNGFSTTKNKIKKFLTNLKREVVTGCY